MIGRAPSGGPLQVRVGSREQPRLQRSATVRIERLPGARRRGDPDSHVAGGGYGETEREP